MSNYGLYNFNYNKLPNNSIYIYIYTKRPKQMKIYFYVTLESSRLKNIQLSAIKGYVSFLTYSIEYEKLLNYRTVFRVSHLCRYLILIMSETSLFPKNMRHLCL